MESGGTLAKIPNPPRTSAFQQQLKIVETVISTDGLSQDLEGTLNQNKLENVTTVLQATTSYLQKAPGKNTYASRFSQISSLAGEQKTSLPQEQQEGMRTSLRKITSQLEQIISEELNNHESNLKNLQTQISDAQKTAATDEGNLKADDTAYLNSIAALKKAASSVLANAQSANTQQRAMYLCTKQALRRSSRCKLHFPDLFRCPGSKWGAERGGSCLQSLGSRPLPSKRTKGS